MSSQSIGLPRAVKIYWIATIGLTVLAFLVVGIRRYLLHEGYPYSTVLFIPEVIFTDFTIYAGRFAYFGTQLFFALPGHPFTYPAPLALIYDFFFHWFPHPTRVFLATIFGSALVGTFLLAKALCNAGISIRIAATLALTILVTSYPFMILFDRANVEIVVWVVLACGLVAFARERLWLAAGLIGIAGAMKVVPAIFLMLLLYRRRVFEFVFGAITMAAVTLVSLWVMGPTIPIARAGIQEGLEKFTYMYVYHWRPTEIGFDHSLFGVVKTALIYCRPSIQVVSPEHLHYVYRIYVVAVAVFSIAIFVRLMRLPRLNQIIALACCAMLLPPLSADYTLVHLYVPFALLLLAAIRQEREGRAQQFFLSRIFCYFAILFTPQTYLISMRVGYGGQLKALVLILLLAETLVHPLGSEWGCGSPITDKPELPVI